MQTEVASSELVEIEPLRERIEAWRQTQPKSQAMPTKLWREATAAARRLGAGRVARALGLHYGALKERVLAAEGGARGATTLSSDTQFIELKGFAAVDRTAGGEETVVEVVAADGARLSVRLKRAAIDVAALVSAFRGRP